jgi:SAM-dependent methyltransferase
MEDRAEAPRVVDLSTPNVARMYDYYLGGKDNFAADRDAAEKALEFAPQIRLAAQHNRAFMGRAVRHLAETGIRQFLDIGTGLPTQSNVHEVAQDAAPDARVVYVDNDPVVLTHGRAILGAAENVHIVQADLRHPEEILDNLAVRKRLDFDRPIAILLVAIVHFLPEADDPDAIVARFRDALPPGGHLVLSHVCGEALPDSVPGVTEVYSHSSTPIVARTPERIKGFFGDLELLDPGVVNVAQWRPDSAETRRIAEKYRRPYFLAGVARKNRPTA